jgi:hypothetical protein
MDGNRRSELLQKREYTHEKLGVGVDGWMDGWMV